LGLQVLTRRAAEAVYRWAMLIGASLEELDAAQITATKCERNLHTDDVNRQRGVSDGNAHIHALPA
jgi:hypothetical protein